MKGLFIRISLCVVLALLVLLFLVDFPDLASIPGLTNQADFVNQLENNNVADPVKVSIREKSVRVHAKFKAPVGEARQRDMTFTVPEFRDEWVKALDAQGTDVDFREENTAVISMVFQIFMLLLIIGAFWFFMVRQMQSTHIKAAAPKPIPIRRHGKKLAIANLDGVSSEIIAKAIGEAIEENGRAVLAGLIFDADTVALKPESKPALNGIAEYLKAHPNRCYFVVGHSDIMSATEDGCSTERAQAVIDALARGYGIESAKLEARGVGALVPLGSNALETGRAKNRRVELVERQLTRPPMAG